MTLYFITGNEHKFQEIQRFLPNIERMDIDLPEIQSSDGKEIITEKLMTATRHHDGEFIVEDTSLNIEAMHGLPGPLVKWFLHALGPEGLYEAARRTGNLSARATAIIGYSRGNNDLHFFEGTIQGTLVAPRGNSGFGWDSIFQPEGCEQTFAEMSRDEKNKMSHRSRAIKKFILFLEK